MINQTACQTTYPYDYQQVIIIDEKLKKIIGLKNVRVNMILPKK